MYSLRRGWPIHALGTVFLPVIMFRTVSTARSTLRVAACNPGSVPYAVLDANGTSAGFDIGMTYDYSTLHTFGPRKDCHANDFEQICGVRHMISC